MNTSGLVRCGFDIQRLAYAGRTALAACLALTVAWMLGLEHPQWAGMTVWAASQPTRGQLLEKSFFRCAGTVSGTVAGILMVLASSLHPCLLIIGLALWVGLCAGIGNLQRGFVAYGTIMAGITAAMVALIDTAHPDRVLHLGADRMATVLTGVIVAMIIGLLFAPAAEPGALQSRVRLILADLMQALADHCQGLQSKDDTVYHLISDIATVEDMLDQHSAGSRSARREARQTRMLLGATIPVLLWLRGTSANRSETCAALLTEAAACLRKGNLDTARNAMIRAQAASSSSLQEVLGPLAERLGSWSDPGSPSRNAAEPVALHRDWIGAREAMIRAMFMIGLFGTIWLVTRWSVGPYMLLGLTVMLTVFSAFDNPAATMRSVFIGQCLGVIGALACRWLAWPMAATEAEVIALTMPFILFGALLVAHRRTVTQSFDYNMVILLMLQPAWPLAGTFSQSVLIGLSIMAAPAIALLAYRMIYPAGVKRRLATLITMMLRDLQDLAADPKALGRRQLWRIRLHHRMLRLVRLAERSGYTNLPVLDGCLTLLDLGHTVMRSHEILGRPETGTHERRVIETVLRRLQRVATSPEQACATLRRAAHRLSGTDAALFARAADHLATQTVFFQMQRMDQHEQPDSLSSAPPIAPAA